MRTFVSYLLALAFMGLGVLAQQKRAPEKLTFMTKNGAVTFDHAAHIKRANGECSTCHDKLFKQDAKAPLNYKASLHKTAEMDKTRAGRATTPVAPPSNRRALREGPHEAVRPRTELNDTA
jgi:hypothetical protein